MKSDNKSPLERIAVDECKHLAVYYIGSQDACLGESIPLFNCSHPVLPYCGGTFGEKILEGRTVSICFDNKVYLLKKLEDWYKK